MIIGEVVKLARLNRVKLNGEDPVAGIPLAALVHQAHELPGGAHRRQVFGRGDNKRHAVAALGGVQRNHGEDEGRGERGDVVEADGVGVEGMAGGKRCVVCELQ